MFVLCNLIWIIYWMILLAFDKHLLVYIICALIRISLTGHCHEISTPLLVKRLNLGHITKSLKGFTKYFVFAKTFHSVAKFEIRVPAYSCRLRV